MQTWRKIMLLLMIIALTGPWVVERLSIPEPHGCENGFRIDENFCGYPIMGIQIFLMLFGSIFGIAFRLIVGAGSIQEFAMAVFVVLFILAPIISMILFIATKDRPYGGGDAAHLGILSFAVILGLFGTAIGAVELRWELWGIWLYILLLISELAAELLRLGSRRIRHQSQ